VGLGGKAGMADDKRRIVCSQVSACLAKVHDFRMIAADFMQLLE